MGYRSPENPLATSPIRQTVVIFLLLAGAITLLFLDLVRWQVISLGTLLVIAVLSALFVVWRNRMASR